MDVSRHGEPCRRLQVARERFVGEESALRDLDGERRRIARRSFERRTERTITEMASQTIAPGYLSSEKSAGIQIGEDSALSRDGL
jgi:hypothetical protein